ncbi:MAG: LysM peptidoglycan-binding domain-containing protein [Anaerolineae bacterium]|nr:LysM peptidoglycan-binding domain-containing protein [Anaerolineae bacterium]
MPKDDISHLPPDVQASIKAARKKATADADKEKPIAPKARPSAAKPRTVSGTGRRNPTAPPRARGFVRDASYQETIEKKWAEGEARKKEREEAKTYVVKAGDSLSKIAKEHLGDAARWPEIFELNKDQIKDPNLIHVGQELRLP